MRFSESYLSRICRTFGVLAVVVCAVASLAAADKKADTKAGTSTDKLAQCLTEKKATMYGDFRCPHCADQKAMFGESFKKVTYVECGIKGQPPRVQTQVCRDLQIKNYPTWTFADGDRLIGPQPLQKLAEKTGCKAP